MTYAGAILILVGAVFAVIAAVLGATLIHEAAGAPAHGGAEAHGVPATAESD